ncbi:MAG: hydrogenase 4 subunit B [Thiobacillus sp.]|uniref:hydrogenase 4 subunit B n=1 Tax=Thiobacillus sp. TaxID=924 RepID=UPI0028947C28|nr:hydrogenase 4 subunit B [Thiobacillus sp.]MDT3705903.1 hydrogenase 4 subunit B [Thiobacillus sp.]
MMETFPLLSPSPVQWAWGVVLFWLVLGFASLLLQGSQRLLIRLVFPLGALGALGVAGIGVAGLIGPASSAVLPIGLPDLLFHLRLDALSAFFLLLLGGAAFGITVYASGYFKSLAAGPLALLALWYHLFLAGMVTVMLANDAYAFMVAWEVMALASYFLVTTDHKIPEIRSAGFLYLLIAHIGAVALLLTFGVLQGGHGDYTFDTMRTAEMTPFWASAAFLLALFGFGAKAGLVPMHVWLPEAHPAAPSPVSALMSGVMLKTAIYGLLRVTFDLLNVQIDWWGTLALALGLVTALYGVIFAAVQSDMKRLLAWSSIENIGVIIAAFGLTLIFYTDGKGALAALSLTALLYHALNHAFFKGLLFVGTGSVLHATGVRQMGLLGGLMRFMPWTAWLTLVGALAIAGLPPLNGFVSEWLLLQAFLLTPGLSHPYLNMVIPVAAATVALAAALAAYVMVKFFGVIFLGQPRDPALHEAHEAGWRERLGMLWLAAGCVLLGLFPVQMIGWLSPVARLLVGETMANNGNWLVLAPVSAERASYSPLIFFAVVLAVLLLIYLWVRRVYHGRVRRSAPWDCGYPEQDARMQDSAEGFGQPIRQIFEIFMRVERETPDPFDRKPHYRGASLDKLWFILYEPIARLTNWLSEQAGRLQHGRIQWYLIYSFATLIFLLVFTTR